MNILYLNPAGYIGGAEKSLIDLVTHLAPGRFRALVVQLSPGPLKDVLREKGIECEEITLPPALLRLSRGDGMGFLPALLGFPLLSLPVVKKLCSLIRSRDLKIIHTNGIKAHLLGCVLSPFIRRPLIWHFRDLPGEGTAGRTFRVLTRLFPRRIIANSRKVKEQLGGLEKIEVIYNAVEVQLFKSTKDLPGIRNSLGLNPAAVAIGTVGHFAPLKGYEDFVRAMPLILGKVPEAKFLIVGEAIYPAYRDYRQMIEKLVARMGLREKVIFPGYRDDLPQVLNALDIFVLPSRSEGFGRANLEAMAAGKPVVSTDVGGIPEVVKDGETGILVPPYDPPALAEAILKLAEDSGLRKKLGRAGRERAELFSVRKMVEGVVKIYDEVLSGGG